MPNDGPATPATRVTSLKVPLPLFLKSRQPAVRNFFAAAQQSKFGPDAEEVLNRFQQTGWTSEVMEALSEYGMQDRL